MARFLPLTGWLLAALPAAAAVAAAPHPRQLAAESDFVVLAQLERTDYDYRRGFPVGGRAWFRVLLAYKAERPMERLIVHEEGLKDIECYFPDRPAKPRIRVTCCFLSEAGTGACAATRPAAPWRSWSTRTTTTWCAGPRTG